MSQNSLETLNPKLILITLILSPYRPCYKNDNGRCSCELCFGASEARAWGLGCRVCPKGPKTFGNLKM